MFSFPVSEALSFLANPLPGHPPATEIADEIINTDASVAMRRSDRNLSEAYKGRQIHQ